MPDDTSSALPATEFARALPIDQLAPSPFNPRRHTDAESLNELAHSITEHRARDGQRVQPAGATHARPPAAAAQAQGAGRRHAAGD